MLWAQGPGLLDILETLHSSPEHRTDAPSETDMVGIRLRSSAPWVSITAQTWGVREDFSHPGSQREHQNHLENFKIPMLCIPEQWNQNLEGRGIQATGIKQTKKTSPDDSDLSGTAVLDPSCLVGGPWYKIVR